MKKPRIHVALEPELFESIQTIARLSDMSMSAFVSSMLNQQQEAIRQIADVMQEAREAADKLPLSAKLRLTVSEQRLGNLEAEARKELDGAHLLVSDAKNGLDPRGRHWPEGRDRPLAINKGAKLQLSGPWKDL